MALSAIPEIQTLRRTLMRWRRQVLAYFICGLTNGRTEGFNNKAKLVKKRRTDIGPSKIIGCGC
jgi:transposase